MSVIGSNRNFNNPIQLVFKEVVSLLDIFQLIAVSDQRSGIDLALFNQTEGAFVERLQEYVDGFHPVQ